MEDYTTYGGVFIDVSFDKNGNRCWRTSFRVLPEERKYGCESLNGMGFYYYHYKEKTKKEAFEILKAHMIKKHKEEIENLQKSLDKLQKLRFKE